MSLLAVLTRGTDDGRGQARALETVSACAGTGRAARSVAPDKATLVALYAELVSHHVSPPAHEGRDAASLPDREMRIGVR